MTIEQANKDGKPFFVWWNGTRMHFRTHVKPEHRGTSGQDEYSDGMVEHDMHAGNFLPYLTGKEDKGPRMEIFYFSDDGDLTALRWGDWKAIFMEQTEATLRAWIDPFIPLRIPLMFNLRSDPYERAEETSNTYYDWLIDHAYIIYGAQAIVGTFSLQEGSPNRGPRLSVT